MKFLHDGKLRNMTSIYLRNGNKILLLYRQGNSIVSNLWIGSAGGHFIECELNDSRKCVLRELFEELNITENMLQNLSLRYVTLRYTDGEIRQNYYYFADLSNDIPDVITSNEGISKWFLLDELKTLPMPFTARYVIDHYVAEGQYNNNLYGAIADSNQVSFHIL